MQKMTTASLALLMTLLFTAVHTCASTAIQLQKQGDDKAELSIPVSQLKLSLLPLFKRDDVSYVSRQLSAVTQATTCTIANAVNPHLFQQVFNEACPVNPVKDAENKLYAFSPGLLEQSLHVPFNLTWRAPYSLEITNARTMNCPGICGGKDICIKNILACFCVEVFFRPVMTGNDNQADPPKRLLSECGILEETYVFNHDSRDGDLACGSLEFIVFAVNPVGNGTASSVLAALGRPQANSIQPEFVQNRNAWEFSLPPGFYSSLHPEVVIYTCEELQIRRLPNSAEFSENGTLSVSGNDNINSQSLYTIEAFVYLRDPLSGFILSPPENTTENICSTVRGLRELLQNCSPPTTDTTPSETSSQTPSVTTSENPIIGAIIGGSLGGLVVVGLSVSIPAIGVLVYIRKRRTFDVPQQE